MIRMKTFKQVAAEATITKKFGNKELTPVNYGQEKDDQIARNMTKRRKDQAVGNTGESYVPEAVSKIDRSMMAHVEKRAVKTAEKANVGSMPRAEKEAWVDQYNKDNNIPKGALGSAIYSGVMKVRAQKVVAESVEEIDEISDNLKGRYLDKAVQQRYNRFTEPWDPKKEPKWATPGGKPKKGYYNQPAKIKANDKDVKRGDIIDKTAKKLTGKSHYSHGTDPYNASDWWKGKKYSKESVEEIDEVLDIAGRIKRGQSLRRNKAKLKIGRLRQANRLADKDRLKDRARRHARSAIVKRITKGQSKSDLSPQRKAEIERRLDKMKGRIDIISKRLLPSVRKDDIAKKRGHATSEPQSKATISI